MKKYLICDLPRGGFGAILDRRIVVAKIAEDYGRKIIFRIGDHQYDDPFENDHSFDKFDEKFMLLKNGAKNKFVFLKRRE